MRRSRAQYGERKLGHCARRGSFGGVLVTNGTIDKATAEAINEIFFEVLIAPAFDEDALEILRSKKNRILLQLKQQPVARTQYKSLLNGVLAQGQDEGNYAEWKEAGGRETTEAQRADLDFANLVCKHLKSNAIALVKNKQLVGKGCGQTSRIDSLRQAVEKAKQFKFDLNGAVLASDASSRSMTVCNWAMKPVFRPSFNPAAPSAIKIQLNTP